MANNNFNPNRALARSSVYQLQTYNSHPVVQITSGIVKFEESVKIVWSNECNKSAKLRSEFEAWDEYDRNHG